MAASTKAARRLGPNDMANVSEVLLNLVSARQAEGAEGFWQVAWSGDRPQRRKTTLGPKGMRPVETLQGRLDTPVRPSGERNCLSRSVRIEKRNWATPIRPTAVETDSQEKAMAERV